MFIVYQYFLKSDIFHPADTYRIPVVHSHYLMALLLMVLAFVSPEHSKRETCGHSQSMHSYTYWESMKFKTTDGPIGRVSLSLSLIPNTTSMAFTVAIWTLWLICQLFTAVPLGGGVPWSFLVWSTGENPCPANKCQCWCSRFCKYEWVLIFDILCGNNCS